MAHKSTTGRAVTVSRLAGLISIILLALTLLVAACANGGSGPSTTPIPMGTSAVESATPSPTPGESAAEPTSQSAESTQASEELLPKSSYVVLASREFQALRVLDLVSGETINYPTDQWENGQPIDLTATVNDQGMAALRSERAQLQLFQLPAPEPIANIELVDSSFFPALGEELTDEFRERTYAIRRHESQPRWSPDGSRLAVGAALGDGKVNPYILETGHDQLSRLADLPAGSLPLTWSPTGESLLVVSADAFTPYSYQPLGLHLVALDSGSVRSVKLSQAEHPLVFMGWFGQDQALVAQQNLTGRLHSLTFIDFDTGTSEMLIPDRFVGAAVADGSDSMLVAGRSDRPGLIELFEIEAGDIKLMADFVLEGDAGAAAYFVDLGAFAVESSNGTVLVSQAGEIIQKFDDARGLPYPSPDGNMVAFGPSNGFYDGTLQVFTLDGERVLASERTAEDLIWRPDSTGLFFTQTVGSMAVADLASGAVVEPWIERGDQLRLLTAEEAVLPSFETMAVAADGAEATGAGETEASQVRYLQPGTPLMLTELQMEDSSQGWALGFAEGDLFERVLYTQDAGESWREVTPPRPQPPTLEDLQRSVSGPRQVASLFALDGSRAWVSYANPRDLNAVVVWRTVDGGSSWQASKPIDVTRGTDYGAWVSGFLPLGFEFVDDQVGWLYAMTEVPASMMAGDSILLRTEDGGQTWDYVHVTATFGYQGMHFFDRLNGYRLESNRIGDFSSVLRTRDGGEYWFQDPKVQSGREPNIFDPEPPSCLGAYQLEELSADTMKMVQHCRVLYPETGEQLQNQLLVTADSGQSWQSSILPIDGLSARHFNTEFVNQQVGWLLDYQSGALQRTMDGGDSWNRVNTVAWEGELLFIDPLNGWAVAWEAGTNAFNREYALVRTADSGYSWELIKPVVK